MEHMNGWMNLSMHIRRGKRDGFKIRRCSGNSASVNAVVSVAGDISDKRKGDYHEVG